MLTQTPLVITPKGDLVPAPPTTLVEGRIVAPATSTALVFHTLEGRRALLRSYPRPQGGLVALAPQALIPMGGTCLPGEAAKLDMRTVCMSCHGPSGDRLTGNMSHGPQRLRVADSADLLGRISITEKQRRPEWSALRRWQ